MEKLTCLLLLSAAVLGVVPLTSGSDPLYLTPIIERGDIAGAQTQAKVENIDLLLLGIDSYSGYFTVNKTYNSNLFFWYFPAKNNAASAPVVVWLQGGPGASSLYGLFMESGPVFVNEQNKLQKRQVAWNADHHVIYIDNPVGAGFSFTESDLGYATNEVDVGTNLFSAVRQFFILFPALKNNRFYVAGESYAGKYVPALGHAIYDKRNSGDTHDRINLKGVAIGNGVTDPIHQLYYGDYFYQLGFIDSANLAIFNQYQQLSLNYLAQGNSLYAMYALFTLINSDGCLFNNLTGFTSPYYLLSANGYDTTIDRVSNYLVNSNLKNSLHVGSRSFVPFTASNVVLTNLESDIMNSVAPWVADLANNYQVLIYNGLLDLLVSSTLTENYLFNLPYNGLAALQSAVRKIWKVKNDVAGYYKIGGNLTHVSVRNAGHMVPVDQPDWAYVLLKSLTFETGL